tara:strand:- start:887 stop:1396 length:510 start_codon:yes stop_codon:yes gene_type:complete
MKQIQIKDSTINIKSELSEISIDLLHSLMVIVNTTNNITKVSDSLAVLSDSNLTPELISDLPFDECNTIIDDVFITATNNNKLSDTFIDSEGNVYKLDGNADSFGFKVGHITKLSNFIQNNNIEYLHFLAAILYKNKDISLNKRADIFKEEMTADIIFPFINLLQEKYA